MEVTGINRQSYMAEVGNLLELITDSDTRTRLIAQMEQMFDAAEDEQALIEQIGSPTKVAVALIRFADTKKAEAESQPEPAATAEPIPAASTEPEPAAEEAPAAAEIPEPAAEEPVAEIEEDVFPESAYNDELPEAEFEDDVMPESAYDDELPVSAYDDEEPEIEAEPEAVVEAEPEVIVDETVVEEIFEETEPAVDDALLAEIESAVMHETGKLPAQDVDPIEAAFETAFSEPEAGDDTAAEESEVSEAEAFDAEAEAEAANVPDLAEALRRADESDGAPTFDERETPAEEEADEPFYETRAIGWRVILYLLIPGIVIGLPVFLALFAVSLILIAIGAAAICCAVGVISSAFIGFTVVADMLLVLGAGLSVFAIALVLLWFGIWFLIAVCFGWVRLITRGGLRFTRKEVPVE